MTKGELEQILTVLSRAVGHATGQKASAVGVRLFQDGRVHLLVVGCDQAPPLARGFLCLRRGRVDVRTWDGQWISFPVRSGPAAVGALAEAVAEAVGLAPGDRRWYPVGGGRKPGIGR